MQIVCIPNKSGIRATFSELSCFRSAPSPPLFCPGDDLEERRADTITNQTKGAAARIDPAFLPLLRDFDRAALDEGDAAIVGIWQDLRLAYLNRAWASLVARRGAGETIERVSIGVSLAPAMGVPLAAWARQLISGPRGLRPEGVLYPGSNPLLEQELPLSAFPLSGAGLLLVHSLRSEASRPRPHPQAPAEAAYQSPAGFLLQCSYCRRFRSPGAVERWDWIEAWFAHPPRETSHGICHVCLGIHHSP